MSHAIDPARVRELAQDLLAVGQAHTAAEGYRVLLELAAENLGCVPAEVPSAAERHLAGRHRALLRARRYLRWARRTEAALAAYQRTERAAWDELARVTAISGSLPDAVARVVDSLINTGIEAAYLAERVAALEAAGPLPFDPEGQQP